MMEDLHELAQLISQWNSIGDRIASIIGRPAQAGHISEFVASRVFNIHLHASAVEKGSDGVFQGGPLAGRTVNIKWSAKHDNLMNLNPSSPPDFYLALKGPKAPPRSSRGKSHPWLISCAYLFDADDLHTKLTSRGVAIGDASSIAGPFWDAAEIYPTSRNQLLVLTEDRMRHPTVGFNRRVAPYAMGCEAHSR